MCEREQYLRAVQICEFVLVELNLYLDTHPDNTCALSYFAQINQAHREAVTAYESQFGPLTITGTCEHAQSWDWIQGPWPWDMEG